LGAEIIFVANFDIVDDPGCGVAERGTERAVGGGNRAGNEFKLVEGLLDIGC